MTRARPACGALAARLAALSAALSAALLLTALTAPSAGAQALFRDEAPLTLSLTTNLRDLLRERDSTELRWFGAELAYADANGTMRRVPVELRARGHFRRQARNCSFPPLAIRAARGARDSTILQGNPRLKIVTPCRPSATEYQQYILLEYLMYRTYSVIHGVHHRTRLARITYNDSTAREKPVVVTTFFLEIEEEVAEEHKLEFVEHTGARWADVVPEALDRLSLFEFWIGNTDWSLGALHNISLFRNEKGDHVPVAYDFDWSGAVGARYAVPNAALTSIRSVKERLHRGPCRTAERWAPTIAHYQSKRAAVDSVWAQPVPGLQDKVRAGAKAYLDQFWPIIADPRRFKRDVIDTCLEEGN
jgi:hypothetical protein